MLASPSMIWLTPLLLFVVGTTSAVPIKCPAFSEWKPWTECLWYPVQDMYKNLTAACDIKAERNLANLLRLPKEFHYPERCGHCSFKSRCRSRERSDTCFPIEYENQVCHDHSDICTMPTIPHMGCAHDVWREILSQCGSRPDISDNVRSNYRKMFQNVPQTHCIEKDGQCKCCCGDYEPNETGTECIRPPAVQCPAFEKSPDWSECLWFPLKEMEEKALGHCKLEKKEEDFKLSKIAAPEGLQIPEKCGFCSFRVSCESRERKDGCFPIKIEKKNCGPDDCPTCGDICSLEKFNGSCHWTRNMLHGIYKDFTARSSQAGMPHWRRDGVIDILKMLPYGNCKEVGDKCKCCCHPYEPNEDGSACVIKDYCKTMKELKEEHEKPQQDDIKKHNQSSESSEEHTQTATKKQSSESDEHHGPKPKAMVLHKEHEHQDHKHGDHHEHGDHHDHEHGEKHLDSENHHKEKKEA